MINKAILQDALADYKRDFLLFDWKDEQYKWQAIRWFQNHWNIDAENFADMLDESLAKAYNLLTSGNYYARGMIVGFAGANPEYTRIMFRELYDESKDFFERMSVFKEKAEYALKTFTPEASNHFQDEKAISIYLWLKYPDKYYIYKYGEVKRMIDSLESDYVLKKGAYEANVRNAYALYEEMHEAVSKDSELISLFENNLTDDCYPDPNYHTLTFDVGFYISRYYSQKDKIENTLGDDDSDSIRYWLYAPGNGAEYWDEFYNKGIMGLGWDEIGDYSQYDSKEEIKTALQKTIDSSRTFSNVVHAIWQFANEMKPGDVIYVKKGLHNIIGRGVVKSDYRYAPDRLSMKNIREVEWTHKGMWPHPGGQAAMKTLTDITAYTEYMDLLANLFASIDDPDTDDKVVLYEPYESDDFLSEVYMTEDEYNSLVTLVQNKKNVILQGAPGVGKTFAARRLVYSIMGEKDKSRVMMVQFHQSYSYEDFIMGFRPTENGFELKTGAFYDFCKEAEIDSENDYFFIIDEINRGNLSKIFGELFMLIETDKRGIQLRLLYSNEKFSVPKNVYIIGMMNTADRSLAMLDYALRRRFAFYEMKPGFETDGFKKYQDTLDDSRFNALIECVKTLNQRIAEDDSLGEGFCIGHSYFCNLKEVTGQTLLSIVNYELVPLLKEYWFDEPAKVREWTDRLERAIK